MTKPTRPIGRYHGGKWRLAKQIIAALPEHKYYVEPFGGVCSVLLQKDQVPIEVYNDIDEQVVSLLRILRDPVKSKELRRRLELTPFARREFELCFEPGGDDIEEARMWLVRSFQGHGTKSAGKPNGWHIRATMGRSAGATWASWPQQLPLYLARMRSVVIECLPWEALFLLYDHPQALFYRDPPYLPQTRSRSHRKLYTHEMTEADHERLLQAVCGLKARVALSGYDSEMYRDMLAGWSKVTFDARAQGSRPRVECLWLSPNCERHPSLPGLE